MLLVITACSGDSSSSVKPPKIVGQGPYLCQVVPEGAPGLLYPIETDEQQKVIYSEARFSNSDDMFGNSEFACSVTPKDPTHPGDITYRHFRGDAAVRYYNDVNKHVPGEQPVDKNLGIGFLNSDSIVPFGWVYWRCGKEPVVSEMDYKKGPGTEERNAREDLTALLRIAQKRFAEIENCEIKPVRS